MVNIYSAAQIKEWDAYTIEREPVASIDLMERAAQKCTDWILAHSFGEKRIKIICGKGNNGGDGLAIARLLVNKGVSVHVYILEFGRMGSEDFQTNLQRLHNTSVELFFLQSNDHLPDIGPNEVVIDALFGSGLNKPLEGLTADLVNHVNSSGATIVSIDVPSGLYIDQPSAGHPVIKAQYTLTFECYKQALLVAENAPFFGQVVVIPIGLHPGFLTIHPADTFYIDSAIIQTIFQPRQEFAHKGTYGHALMIAGSYGKMGAALLTIHSCLRSGAGLVTAYLPRTGYTIVQTAAPEAMAMLDADEKLITGLPDALEKFTTIGIGPGIGTDDKTKAVLKALITQVKKPIVIDADGLNCLAKEPELLQQLPPSSILTPHPKEFERLFGKLTNDFERIAVARKKAQELRINLILKGHHTVIAHPDGTLYYNSTGNAGMATGGSGDVLTGIITSLVAQGYTPEKAAVLGVYLHGLAGDLAAAELSQEAMLASDIIHFLAPAFKQLNRLHS